MQVHDGLDERPVDAVPDALSAIGADCLLTMFPAESFGDNNESRREGDGRLGRLLGVTNPPHAAPSGERVHLCGGFISRTRDQRGSCAAVLP